MVRAGLGLAIVPAAAGNLKIADVRLRPLKLRTERPVELFLVWQRDIENPLLPSLVEIAGKVGAQKPSDD
jgi:DNA-binding transcriptional LysR family regulator